MIWGAYMNWENKTKQNKRMHTHTSVHTTKTKTNMYTQQDNNEKTMSSAHAV